LRGQGEGKVVPLWEGPALKFTPAARSSPREIEDHMSAAAAKLGSTKTPTTSLRCQGCEGTRSRADHGTVQHA